MSEVEEGFACLLSEEPCCSFGGWCCSGYRLDPCCLNSEVILWDA